ncbi:MAG: hypothetical protein WCL50_02345 [Spirochaetota bacterium]
MKAFSLSVPANLLLLGEYAVLEEEGRGLALAAMHRALVGAEPAASFSVDGKMGTVTMNWDEASGMPAPPLVAACLAAAGFGAEGPRALIRLDSSAFFAPDGRKKGFGSSAAIAVGLVAALLRLRGLAGAELEAAIFPAALAAHRASQGGRGSGYDVAASRFGGVGVFSGGAHPTWVALEDPALPHLALFAGPVAVSSAEAVLRYEAWKRANPAVLAGFLRASQASLDAFLALTDPASRLKAIQDAAQTGIRLGDNIGVEARLQSPKGLCGEFVIKALGAGNELGLLASLEAPSIKEGAPATSFEELSVDPEGLRWD